MVPEPTSTDFDNLYGLYASKLRGWLLHRGVPLHRLPDAEQDFWLEVSQNPQRFDGVKDVRNELLKLAKHITKRVWRKEYRERLQDHLIDPDQTHDQWADSPLEIAQACELLETIDELDDRLRTVFIYYRILGFNTREVAEKLGIDETTVSKRALAASEQIQKKLARKEAKDMSKMGVLLMPASIEIRPEFCAAFCAIWEAEGRLPVCDERKRPIFPLWFVSAVSAAAQTAAKAIVSAARLVVLTVLLLLVPASIIALYYCWDPIAPATARTGLYVPAMPEIRAIDDVVDAYPAVQAPAAPSARASAAPALTARKSAPALDDDALRILRLDGSAVTRSRQE